MHIECIVYGWNLGNLVYVCIWLVVYVAWFGLCWSVGLNYAWMEEGNNGVDRICALDLKWAWRFILKYKAMDLERYDLNEVLAKSWSWS